MINSAAFIEATRDRGFGHFSGVPCSYLKPFINYVSGSGDLCYIGAANEGDAVAIASGVQLGGGRAVAMFQNSGLGNAVNPLTSLTHVFKIPILVIVTHRGEPGGPADEPQHELMGRVTTSILEMMEIPWEVFPTEESDIPDVLDRVDLHHGDARRPYALLMRKGSVAAHPVPESAPAEPPRTAPALEPASPMLTRAEALQAVVEGTIDSDIILATTGYTGRELFSIRDSANQLYLVGSMGCVLSLGLGLAVSRPDRRIVVLDGDGSALMRLGSFATVGREGPSNLVHILLDNGVHESTGGQETVSGSMDFAAVAHACGYSCVGRVAGRSGIVDFLVSARGEQARFLHVPIKRGLRDKLPRPAMRPDEVADRLRSHLGAKG